MGYSSMTDAHHDESTIVIKATLPGIRGTSQEKRKKAEEIAEALQKAGWSCEIVSPQPVPAPEPTNH